MIAQPPPEQLLGHEQEDEQQQDEIMDLATGFRRDRDVLIAMLADADPATQ